MIAITSPARVLKPRQGWLARRTVVALANEEFAVIAKPTRGTCRVVYQDELASLPTPPILRQGETAFIFPRELSAKGDVELRAADGAMRKLAVRFVMRVLRPLDGTPHPLFAKIKPAYAAELTVLHARLARLIHALLAPSLQRCRPAATDLGDRAACLALAQVTADDFRRANASEHVALRELIVEPS